MSGFVDIHDVICAAPLSVSGRALVAAVDTAVVARGLMYTSVRQASSDLASALVGPETGPVVAEGMDTIVAAQTTASWVTCHGIGWLLQALRFCRESRLTPQTLPPA